METKFEISVVIPMYNSEKSILYSLESIKNQSVQPNEIIIVDDGSTDSSSMLVRNFTTQNPNLNIRLIQKANGGVSSARNLGMKQAKSDWIALLDSDDEWYKNKLELQIEILRENNKIDFLGTSRANYKVERILWLKINRITKIPYKYLFLKFIFQPSTVIFKKKILSSVGYFDEKQRYAEEGIFFINICSKYECYFLNENLVFNGGGKEHFGVSGLSGNLQEMEKGELKNLKDAYSFGLINFFEFAILTCFSMIKYFRRILIVKLRK